VPLAQASHRRSAIALPAVLTYVPAAQVDHAVQLGAFVVVLYVPLAQPVQVRFAVALPAKTTDCPGTQLVQATQAVAGFSSWSQVPAAQASFGAVAPAQ